MFHHILLPLDGSILAECVLPHCFALAKAVGARISLIRVLERSSHFNRKDSVDAMGWFLARQEASAYLKNLTDQFRMANLDTNYQILEGEAAQRTLEFVTREKVDLVILSSHGLGGLGTWTMSSVAQKIALSAHISTMIIRAFRLSECGLDKLKYRRILVPLDGSRRAEHFLLLAETLTEVHQAELLAVHIVRHPETMPWTSGPRNRLTLTAELLEKNQKAASLYLENLESRLHGRVRTRLIVAEDVALALHEVAQTESADLILISAHGQTGRTKWPYGSVAANLLWYGQTPLLIVQDFPRHQLEPSYAELSTEEIKGH